MPCLASALHLPCICSALHLHWGLHRLHSIASIECNAMEASRLRLSRAGRLCVYAHLVVAGSAASLRDKMPCRMDQIVPSQPKFVLVSMDPIDRVLPTLLPALQVCPALLPDHTSNPCTVACAVFPDGKASIRAMSLCRQRMRECKSSTRQVQLICDQILVECKTTHEFWRFILFQLV